MMPMPSPLVASVIRPEGRVERLPAELAIASVGSPGTSRTFCFAARSDVRLKSQRHLPTTCQMHTGLDQDMASLAGDEAPRGST